MKQPDLKVGTVIIDGDKLGIITAIIENGVWKELGPFSLHKNYEIKYFDGKVILMTEATMRRLIELGRIEVLTS